MRVLVCGGRRFDDYHLMRATLNKYAYNADVIIHGCAPGADLLAQRWADSVGIRCHAFEANWESHGRGAGPLRNQRMLDEGSPDLVIAFPGGKGTADLVRRAKAAGIPVREIS